MGFLQRMLLGLTLGIASITPGVSGGAIAAAFGLYERIIRSVSHFFADIERNVRFLLPLGLGVGIGIVGFSNLMEWLMQAIPDLVIWLFLGLMAGSLPTLLRTANSHGWRPQLLGWTGVAMLIMFLLTGPTGAAPAPNAEAVENWANCLFYGVILAIGTIVPGLSSSFILISLGSYEELLGAIAHFRLSVLVPAGIGFVVSAILLVRVVEWVFSRFHAQAYYTVLGLLLASALLIVPDLHWGWSLLAGTGMFAGGLLLSGVLLKLSGGEL